METLRNLNTYISQMGLAISTALALPSYFIGIVYWTDYKPSQNSLSALGRLSSAVIKTDSAFVPIQTNSGLLSSNLELLNQGPLSPVKDFTSAKAQAKELLQSKYKGSLISKTLRTATSAGLSESAYSQFIVRYISQRLPAPFKTISSLIAQAIEKEAQARGLDPFLLLAVIQTESSFRPQIRGLAGELGLMQLMPKTAEWLAKKNRIEFLGEASLRNPVENIRLGAVYLSHLRGKFDSNGHLYLTAYNMGTTKLKRKIASEDKLPEIYATKIMKNYNRLYSDFAQKAVAGYTAAKASTRLAYSQ